MKIDRPPFELTARLAKKPAKQKRVHLEGYSKNTSKKFVRILKHSRSRKQLQSLKCCREKICGLGTGEAKLRRAYRHCCASLPKSTERHRRPHKK